MDKRKTWTKDQDNYLRERWHTERTQVLCSELEKSYSAVYQHARLLNLGPKPRLAGQYSDRKPKYNAWTEEQDGMLRRMHGRFPQQKIAEQLGRSIGAINYRANVLGIDKPKDTWSDSEIEILRQYFPLGGTHRVLIELQKKGYKRSKSTIRAHAIKNGISTEIRRSYFDEIASAPKSEFYKALQNRFKKSNPSENLSYKILADICYLSHSRVQKWFAPSSTQRLNSHIKHHMWLAVAQAMNDVRSTE